MPLAAKSMLKNFMKLAAGDNFIKCFWPYLCPLRHNLNQNIRQYANSSVNYAKKVL
jgi:hypothetical protein